MFQKIGEKKNTNNRLAKQKKLIAATTKADRAILEKLYYELFFWGTVLSLRQKKKIVPLPILQKYPPKKTAFRPFSDFVATTNRKNA